MYCTAQYLSRVGGGKRYRKCNLDEDSQRVARRPAENVAVRGCYAVAIVAILYYNLFPFPGTALTRE
jgi:hypothetical protein